MIRRLYVVAAEKQPKEQKELQKNQQQLKFDTAIATNLSMTRCPTSDQLHLMNLQC